MAGKDKPVEATTPNSGTLTLLISLKLEHAKFAEEAIKFLWIPVSNVNSERFLSLYKMVVNDRRTRMKEDTIEICTMLAFN